ncbi:MAG: hypothetical protein IGS49_06155 [Chlorogloeopsis fritschii C42_A2020_084]|uniref:DUF6263 family protein n=1 Tax=Chlorogloeopsis fritschii TaxID=1124 RepID=UPI0019DA49E0|nr:DUF6263 family protein [Chlorogloeopsis fritschii]MBF2005044.1 hypothetical protein [Chlorogloeopsis fritschii C42_A2020_084]
MKRTFFVGGIIYLIVGLGLQPSVTSVQAETPLKAKPVINNAKKPSPTAKQPQIELLNPGTGAKQQLRFKPPVKFKQAAIMTMNMDMAMSIAGQALPAFKQPATVMTLQTAVTKIAPNGDIHYEFSYSDIDFVGDTNLPPQVLNTVRSQIQNIRGIKGSAIVDNRGYTRKVNLVLPTGLDPNLKQMMQQMSNSLEQLSSPLPQQAVGIGSRWRVTSTVNINGMNLKQIATYQLVNLKNGVATLNIGVEQLASPSQKLTAPGLPPGVTLTLKSYNGKGQGQAIVPLNKLMPIRSTMSLRSNSEMTQTNPGSVEETPINQKLSMTMSIESK